ncbi:MAG: YdeI/OmpD-associated family protein [Aggregatilineales bacterium]
MITTDINRYFEAGCGRCPLFDTPDCKVHNWRDAMIYLRDILLQTDLVETMKWGVPCYMYDGKNVLLMSALKDYGTLGFLKGVLLDDPDNILIQPTKNTRSQRQLKFTSVQQIMDIEPAIKACIENAIAVEKAGLEVIYEDDSDDLYPDELEQKFNDDPALRQAFEALTPGRQRGYLLHFSGAKQSKTRTRRIEKYAPKIMSGKGFHDR